MEHHGTPLWLERTLIAIAAAMFALCLLIGEAQAVPHVYWDPLNTTGVASDTSADPYKKTSPVLTWERCLALGVMGDTIGLKQMSGDTPNIEVIRAINAKKADRIITHNQREVIPGHGEMLDEDIDASADGGFCIRQRWTWEQFIAPNGQLAERCVDVSESVEVK